MSTGMLWFDNDPRTNLEDKINKAAAYYQKKYGCKPTLCFINPATTQTPEVKSTGIEVRPNQMVLPNHLWLGMQPI